MRRREEKNRAQRTKAMVTPTGCSQGRIAGDGVRLRRERSATCVGRPNMKPQEGNVEKRGDELVASRSSDLTGERKPRGVCGK
jgi:hypothetical protein